MSENSKETVTDEILEDTEQEAAEELVQESDEASAADTSETAAEEAAENREAGEAGDSEEGTPETAEKRKLFGKKKDKRDRQIEELTAQAADLTDRLKRSMAEFDNYRKRTEKEKSAMFDLGAKSIIEKLLPVVDNFERGFSGLTEEQKSDAFVSGMDMIYKQLTKTLQELGVEPIEAVGKPFDPNHQNAVMHVEDENQGENIVVHEFQKGYLYHGSVVRHSMVQVAN